MKVRGGIVGFSIVMAHYRRPFSTGKRQKYEETEKKRNMLAVQAPAENSAERAALQAHQQNETGAF
ncbi:hypothetical protein AT6N2_C1355 [Agrobacterium tumefaciens]|nr:hypothetical protein AT6N2_C1355 [Agrobacterium tumefaciens]